MIGSGFRIGKIQGITIRVDWSWLFIVLLISWNLSTIFRQLHPEWSMAADWGIALLAALLFFLSVLAHELAHSLVARAQGLPVRNITLFLFGGVSNIEREPGSPKDEFLMAIAGPLTSLVLGVIMLLIAAGGVISARGLGQPALSARSLGPIQTILLWLGSINIILAIFNMIPGFPLDGGRVLRSIIWGATHNLRSATHWAAAIGQAIAWIFIVAGVAMAFGLRIPFFGTGLLSGLWLAFIGWFLNSAAVQSSQQVEIQDLLEGVHVANLMRRNPPTVEADCTVANLVHTHLMGSDDQAFPVMENDRLFGIVTLDDIRKVPRSDWDTVSVRDIMTPSQELVTTTPDEEVSQAMEKLIQRDVRQLPVVRALSAQNMPAGTPGVQVQRQSGVQSTPNMQGTHGTPGLIPATGTGPTPGEAAASSAASADGAKGAAPAWAGNMELIGLLRRRDIMRWLQLHSKNHDDGSESN